MKEMEAFHFRSKDNRVIQQVALLNVFHKAGTFIFNLGFSTCFEFLIRNLILVIHCYEFENATRQSYAAQGESIPLIFVYYYALMKMAFAIGCFLFMATVQTATLDRPWLPTLL